MKKIELLNSLKQEIESNILIYEANHSRFDNLDIQAICHLYNDWFDRSIDEQMNITRKYTKELMEANSALEAVSFRAHDRQEEEQLDRRYEYCKQEYEEQKIKLNELYAMKEQATQEVLPYLDQKQISMPIWIYSRVEANWK